MMRPDWKDRIRNVLRRYGYDLVRYRESVNAPFDVLGLLVREELATGGPFFFVQVGANDGVRADGLRPLILTHGLSGLLIEPLPDQFANLQRNYADQPQLRFAHCAIAATDGEATLYRVRHGAPVPDWVSVLATFARHNLSASHTGIPGIEAHVESLTVPTRTLQGLLEREQVPSVSLLMVDTEGYDYEIVRAALAAGVRPRLIVYEHIHLSGADHVACNRLLCEHGYEFIEVGVDTYARLSRGS